MKYKSPKAIPRAAAGIKPFLQTLETLAAYQAPNKIPIPPTTSNPGVNTTEHHQYVLR